jgi:hypothetical protein
MPMLEIIDVWCVYEGGSEHDVGEPAYFFTSYVTAKAKAQGQGWYGSNAEVEARKAIVNRVDGKVYLLERGTPIDLDGKEARKREDIKHVALSKLTAEERKVLGLEEDPCQKKKP